MVTNKLEAKSDFFPISFKSSIGELIAFLLKLTELDVQIKAIKKIAIN
jgi:hypothetical protein